LKDGKPIEKEIVEVSWDLEAAEKGGYEDFMLKEIFEQPKAVKETLRAYLKDFTVNISTLGLSDEELKDLDRVFILACGTSYHAAWVGKLAIEEWAKIPVEIEISSEFRYRFPVIPPKTLLVAITQSGETADTMAGVREASKRGHKMVAITNVLGSSITRETNGSLITQAGPEIGVAATKTFTTQLVALYLLALKLAQVKGTLADADAKMIINELNKLPESIEQTLEGAENIKKMAEAYKDKPDFLFLGRGFGLPVALEGALKLKEISYIHAEGCAAGEMKHGPIALIDENCPIVAIANRSATYSKVCSNIEEVKARGADVIALISEGDTSLKERLEKYIEVSPVIEALSPVVTTIPLQIFAYYVAKAKGLDVDQPRNLAKSVTVE
jgi:glucosamine--fructose-6-phosphate aminotransferase (isomerizing)